MSHTLLLWTVCIQFDKRVERVDKGDKCSLVFRVCELDDTATYSLEIMEFVKNGERDQTDCWLQVEGKGTPW